jgi:hypothetical protein
MPQNGFSPGEEQIAVPLSEVPVPATERGKISASYLPSLSPDESGKRSTTHTPQQSPALQPASRASSLIVECVCFHHHAKIIHVNQRNETTEGRCTSRQSIIEGHMALKIHTPPAEQLFRSPLCFGKSNQPGVTESHSL